MASATYQMLLKRTVPGQAGGDATLQFLIATLPRPMPQADELVIRVGAAPINPSDLGGMLLGGDRLDEAKAWSHDGSQGVTIPLPEHFHFDAESDWQGLGNEGAGVVEDAGKDVKHLLGKVVFFQGGTFTQLAVRKAGDVQVQPDGVTAKQAASSFVNPMTVLGMLEKMRREGHSGLVHTAAASQLGQMLVRVCLEEQVPLVNIVRRPEQVKLLKSMGASHVVDSSAPSFREDLVRALAETGATMAFDAIGGGPLASVVLESMEAAAWARGDKGSWYGSSVWKQVYTYGRLDPAPAEMSYNYGGYRWNLGGYLVSDFLETVSEEWREAAKLRIAQNLGSTFLTNYGKEWTVAAKLRIAQNLGSTFLTNSGKEVSLKQLLEPASLKLANSKSTEQKILIVP